MGLIASCPRCGLSMQVLDLGIGGPPLCPNCAVPLEELPEAEVVGGELPPPSDTTAPPPPLAPAWQGVRQGLRLMHRGLLVLFAGWELLLLAVVTILIFRIADKLREESDTYLLWLPLAANAVALLVLALFVAARRRCRSLDKETPAAKLAHDCARLTAVAALLWLLPPALLLLGLVLSVPYLLVVIGWGVALVCGGVAEVLFLRFLREVGRILPDKTTQDHVARLLRGLGLFGGAVAGAAVLVGLLSAVLPGREGTGAAVFGVLLLIVVLLLGVGSSALLVRYLLAVLAARRVVEQRLPAAVAAPAQSPGLPPDAAPPG